MQKAFSRGALALALAGALVAAGCGGDDGGSTVESGASPEEVVDSFYGAVADNDAEAACALVTEETAQQAADQEDADSCEEATSFGDGASLAESIEVGDAEIDGDKATVEVSSSAQEGTGTVDLVQEDGEWKIDLAG